MHHRTRVDPGIVRPADIEPEPWANGLGVTRVLAARPAWRISLAEIEGRMPFSPFLGADRVLIPLSPRGVSLEIDGVVRAVAQHAGVAFRGENRVVAETDGRRVSVVNFMTRRSTGRMRWQIMRVDGPVRADADVLVVLGGDVQAGSESLPPGTAVRPAQVADLVASAGVIAQLRVSRRG